MAYKKYIKRDGKIYGPYIYQSKRVDGKVISEYCGAESKIDYKKIAIFIFGILILISLIVFIFNNKENITGNIILNKQVNSQIESVQQNLSISLKEGEFVPSLSKIVFETSENNYEYFLSDLILNEAPSKGDYYIEGNSISGNGEGYGLKGEEIIYPSVYFTLILKKTTPSQEEVNLEETVTTETTETTTVEVNVTEPITETIPEETIIIEEPVVENSIEETTTTETTTEPITETIPEETIIIEEPVVENSIEETTTTESTSETNTATETTTTEEPSLSITGGVISNLLKSVSNFFLGLGITGRVTNNPNMIEINGETSKDKPFVYSLQDGESFELLSGSVKTDSNILNDNLIQILYQDNQVIVETIYSELKEGFGKEYIGESGKTIYLKVPEELVGKDSNIKIIYNNQDLLSSGEDNEEKIILNPLQKIGKIGPLSDSEKEILSSNFKDQEVKTIKSELFNGRYIVGYEFDKYFIEYSYDSNLSKEDLDAQMEKDRTKWLRDILQRFSEEQIVSQKVDEFNLTFPL